MKHVLSFLITVKIIFVFNNAESLTQYTPEQADWSTFYSKPGDVDHRPDGIPWLRRDKWVKWDGVPLDTTLPRAEFHRKICPSADTILGLREVFYEHNPFTDPKAPTKAEVDEWHRLSLIHIRRLVGSTIPIEPDHCLFARALWGQQRRFTTMWDQKYPDGNCQGSKNSHCGATFIPSAEDQIPYLPEGHPPCNHPPGAEGISPAPSQTSHGLSNGFEHFVISYAPRESMVDMLGRASKERGLGGVFGTIAQETIIVTPSSGGNGADYYY